MRRLVLVSLLAVTAIGAATTSVARAAESFAVDTVHSGIHFRVKHLGAGFTWGRFNQFSGTITLDEQNPGASSVTIEIKTESVDTNSPDRDKHLRNPDFFDAKTFPVATFKSTDVSKKGDVFTVKGTLELHGVKKPHTLELTRVGTGKNREGKALVGFSGKTTIKRSEFNMNYGLPAAVGDEVELFIDVEAVQK